jgi:hypothetical protein
LVIQKILIQDFFGFFTVINIFLCLFGNCPTTTTATAVYVITVYTRSIQTMISQNVQQKHNQTLAVSYKTNNISTGILYTVKAQSRIACYGVCSLDDMRVGMMYTISVE